jgi:hypothetical protein
MAAKKYLLLQRSPPNQTPPSPAQMQGMFALFSLEISARHRERALESAPTDAVRDLLRRRLEPAG